MNHKLIALFLALNLLSWAQSSTPNQASPSEQKPAAADLQANCPCCDKMADTHPGMACMRHTSAEKKNKSSKSKAMACCAKDMKASCCAQKDGQSCTKDGKVACEGKPGEAREVACCAGKDDKAHECCSGMQCGKHDHQDPAAPGN